VPNFTVTNSTAGQKSGGGRSIFYGWIVASHIFFCGRKLFGAVAKFGGWGV